MMIRLPSVLWAAMLCLLLSGCATLVRPPAAEAGSAADARQAWARVLSRFVNQRGEVDFAALSEDRADLDRYVRHVADTPPDSFADRDERLAYMINAYNALTLYNVIDSGIPATHAGLNKLAFFIHRKLLVGGTALSLYTFENEVIRPLARVMGQPEVHFALNCGARSCPVLPRVPFSGDGLATQLQREARAFFARPENFRIDAASRTVWLSELLKFYPEDFVPAHGHNLIAYANRHAPQAAPTDFEVRFTPYDWTVANSRRVR